MPRDVLWTKDRILFKNFIEGEKMLGWITDPDGYCVYLSPEWYRFTGQSREEADGFGWLKSIHIEDQLIARKAFFRANDNAEFYGVRYRLLSHDGTPSLSLAYGAPRLDTHGNFAGYVGLTTLQVSDGHAVPIPPVLPRPKMPLLSAREREVLSALAQGHKTSEISQTLGVSLRTVEAHARQATLKLGASSRAHACVQAIRFNEIQLSDFDGGRETSLPK